MHRCILLKCIIYNLLLLLWFPMKGFILAISVQFPVPPSRGNSITLSIGPRGDDVTRWVQSMSLLSIRPQAWE